MTTQRLSDLNKELTDAESETLKKRALYEYAESGALDAVPQIRDNSLLQELQRRRAELSVQYTDALNQYGPNFPKVLRIEAQMKDLDEQMTKERKGIIVQLKSDYNEAKAREDLSERASGSAKSRSQRNVGEDGSVQYLETRRRCK